MSLIHLRAPPRLLLISAHSFSVLAFEATTVLVLRAHWTMDVFAGLVAARYATIVAYWIAPSIDRLLGKPQPVAAEQGGNKTKSS